MSSTLAFDVGLRREPTVERGLSRGSLVDLDLALNHLSGKVGVRGIPFQHSAVQNERGLARGQSDLVAEFGLPTALLDDVRVDLEDRDELLVRGYGLALENTTLGLIDDAQRQPHDPLQLGDEPGLESFLFHCLDLPVLQSAHESRRVVQGLSRDHDEIAIERTPLFFLLGILKAQVSTVCSLRVAREADGENLAALLHEPGQDANAVAEQRRGNSRASVGVLDVDAVDLVRPTGPGVPQSKDRQI